MRHQQITVPEDQRAATAQRAGEKLRDALFLVESLAGPELAPSAHPIGQPVTVQQVGALISARRQRAQFFDADLFADPAWDILLNLYAAELSQQRVTVTSACETAAVPVTTALRWIGTLERKGLVVREPDWSDGRRVFVRLSDAAKQKLQSYFSGISTDFPAVFS